MHKKQVLHWPTTFRWMKQIVLKLQDCDYRTQQHFKDYKQAYNIYTEKKNVNLTIKEIFLIPMFIQVLYLRF